jgi:hypothetical protein
LIWTFRETKRRYFLKRRVSQTVELKFKFIEIYLKKVEAFIA